MITTHTIASREEYETAREELLTREKEHTRLGDELAEQRRRLPWVPVEKEYRFDTDAGTRTLGELFDGRSQLLVYHFMFGPNYEAGCPVNSSMVDGFDGLLPHLHARDATMLLVSARRWQSFRPTRSAWAGFPGSPRRTPTSTSTSAPPAPRSRCASMQPSREALPLIAHQNAAACGVDVLEYIAEAPVMSAFALEDGAVHQTYTTTWRGLEFIMGYYPIVDRAPKGRDEGDDVADLDSPS